jgi:hypothetical protein
MVKVEVVISGDHWELNILKREDATEDEIAIAKAMENLHLAIWVLFVKPGSSITRIE